MSRKRFVMIGMFVGSWAGGYVPTLFGAVFLSLASVFGTFIGGILGIWGFYQLAKQLGFY